jgi:hypothetical protein
MKKKYHAKSHFVALKIVIFTQVTKMSFFHGTLYTHIEYEDVQPRFFLFMYTLKFSLSQ